MIKLIKESIMSNDQILKLGGLDYLNEGKHYSSILKLENGSNYIRTYEVRKEK